MYNNHIENNSMNMKFIAKIYSKLVEDISAVYIYTEPIAFWEIQILHNVLELRCDKNTSQVYDLKPGIIRLPLFATYRRPF